MMDPGIRTCGRHPGASCAEHVIRSSKPMNFWYSTAPEPVFQLQYTVYVGACVDRQGSNRPVGRIVSSDQVARTNV